LITCLAVLVLGTIVIFLTIQMFDHL
jgi:hypothetical protein